MISAWSSANQLVLAQMKVDGKSNEITAIPELLALLDLKGAVVSIDAMGHGRIEKRTCDVIDQPILLRTLSGWDGLRSLVRVCSWRQATASAQHTEEVRFYISSAKADAERFNSWVRQHWGIENQVHWMLDVIFDEDGSRIRKGYADQNMATIRKTALNICRLLPDPKRSLTRQRMAAALSEVYLDQLLGFKTR
jgi:predicted transposase YbfD/YdcC